MIAKCVPTDCKIKQTCYRYCSHNRVTQVYFEVSGTVNIAEDCEYFISVLSQEDQQVSKVYVDKTFRISDDSSFHFQLETIKDGALVELSYYEEAVTGGAVLVNSITFPAYFAPVLGKLLLEQFTED